MAVSTGGPYEFIYTNNNTARATDGITINPFVPPVVDLRGTLGALPVRVLDGQQLAVNWTIFNDGPENLLDGWTDRVYLESVTNSAVKVQLGSFRNNQGLIAGASIERTEFVRFLESLVNFD